MAETAEQEQEHGAYKLRRIAKWLIYPLLALNLWFYLDDEFLRVFQTNMTGATVIDWIIEFTSSIDTLAFIALIVLFELETHVVADTDWKGWTAKANRVARGACYGLIGLALFAYSASPSAYYRDVGQPDVDSLCELAGQDVSYVFNLEYVEVDRNNCLVLGDASSGLVYLGEESVVTTSVGLMLERLLGWIDVLDAVLWILILLTIERVIRLQERHEIDGRRIGRIYKLKAALYVTLFLFAAVWAFLSHWLYAWDAVLWIAGFLVIEMNVNQWRDEIRAEVAAGV